MLSRLACLALSCALVGAAPPVFAAAPRDDRGVVIRASPSAARVIALAPHLAEIAFAAGAGERLVGVARFSDFPEKARGIEQIGDASRVDLERILALKPDLILAWKSGNQAGDIARLEELGYPVFVTEPRRLQDVARLLRVVGDLAGSSDEAAKAALAFEADITELRSRYANRPAVRVFYEIWHRPLLTVNGDHMISDVIALCGGSNVFASAPTFTPSVSTESLVAAKPEAILGGSSAAMPQQFVSQWRGHVIEGLRNLPAYYVAPDDIQRATPRIVNGARAICAHLEEVRQSRRESSGR